MKTFYKIGLMLLPLLMNKAQAQSPTLPFLPQRNTAKTTASSERLIARTKLDYADGTGYYFTDSATMEWNWTNFSKAEFLPAPIISFDRASVITFYQNSGGTALPSQKVANYFDADGKNYATYRFRWNNTTSAWDTASRTLSSFSGAQLIDSTLEQYISSRGWIGRQKTTYTYSGAHIGSVTVQTSSGFVTTWVNSSRTSYTWNSSDLLIQWQTERWDATAGAWTKQYLTDVSYTGTDSTLSITKRWNTTAGAWVNMTRRGYKISSIGPYADDSTDTWNATSAMWVHATKNEVVYSAGVISEYIQYMWDPSTGNWGAYNIYYYSYAGGFLTQAGGLRWNTTAAKWEAYYFYNYNYNGAGSLISEIPYTLNSSGTYDPTGNRSNYYYETFTDIKDPVVSSLQASLYPNPATEAGNVNLKLVLKAGQSAQISVVSISGQEVYRKTLNGSGTVTEHLPTQHWAKGLYLVNINAGEWNVETLKLVK